MKIGVIGYGVVGETTGKIFSKIHTIFPYDRYKSQYNSQKNLEDLVRESEVVFVCVPTPMKPSGEMDYSAIHNSLLTILEETKIHNKKQEEMIVVIRSTAVSGTTDKLAEQYPFKFAFNPEFLTEKNALRDMENTDRVIIGTNDDDSKAKLEAMYKPLFPNAKYIFVTRKEAEMIKYAANVFLASQIALANEIFNICKALGINYETIKNAILLDPRIGRNINVPGHDGDTGFGGKCFPKDLNALIYLARENHYRPYLLEEVWRLNEKVRTDKDWLNIPGAVSKNEDFKKE